MSIIHVNQIRNILEKQIVKFVDSDKILDKKKNIAQDELEQILLSRAFTLFCAKSFTGVPYSMLSKYLTDDFHDNGIDLVYYSESNKKLSIIQSKWIKNGKGGVDKAEVLKFLQGVKDLLYLKFEKFNDKIKQHKDELEKAIYNPNISIDIILAYSGTSLSKEIQDQIQSTIDELNDTDEVLSFKEFNLQKAYSFLKNSLEGEPIKAELDIYDWGKVDSPVKSYYGTIYCGQIAELYTKNQKRIFSKNIRGFIGESDINRDISETLLNNPENFVYLNNGITLLCKTVKKSPYGGNDRQLGKFYLEDLSIVNGAQTVGSISSSYKLDPNKVNEAKIFIKIISLENCPKDFDKKVTTASNTQNKIEKRDFVALEKHQERIKNELLLDGIFYHFKRDDKKIIKDNKNIYLEEATIALACYDSEIDYSTYAKREIGKLWENTSTKPYILLFNDKLMPHKLVTLVKIFRGIENYIRNNTTFNEDQRTICSHGIYLLTHVLFQNLDKEIVNNPDFNINNYLRVDFGTDVEKWTKKTLKIYSDQHENKFALPIFRNFKYCRTLRDGILNKDDNPKVGTTLPLFAEY